MEEEVSRTENYVSRMTGRGERRKGTDMREKEEERESWREKNDVHGNGCRIKRETNEERKNEIRERETSERMRLRLL